MVGKDRHRGRFSEDKAKNVAFEITSLLEDKSEISSSGVLSQRELSKADATPDPGRSGSRDLSYDGRSLGYSLEEKADGSIILTDLRNGLAIPIAIEDESGGAARFLGWFVAVAVATYVGGHVHSLYSDAQARTLFRQCLQLGKKARIKTTGAWWFRNAEVECE